MKRTDRLTKLIAALLFLAFAAYVGVYTYRAISDQTVTAEAVLTSVSVDGTASGIVVRSETLLTSDEPYIDVTVSDGKRVSAGGELGMAMNSETGLERSSRMHELELEISRITAVLGDIRSADDLSSRDSSFREALLNLTGAVARGDFNSLDLAAMNLGSLVLAGGSAATEEDLARLQAELSSLQNSSSADTQRLTAEQSGIFSSKTDGYEHLSPADLEGVTPSKLQTLIDGKADAPEGCFGKLVTDYNWYFAAAMSSVDAANLRPGGSATLDFGKYYDRPVKASVVSISRQEEGAVAVVFRCNTALEDTLTMREVSAQVVFETYEGIRIPTQAIRTDDKRESTFVWVVSAMQLERKNVEIIYAGDGFAVVKREAGANALREGNTVVVAGKDLYEGKIVG